MTLVRLAFILLATAAIVACGGDDAEPTATATATASAPSPSPTEAPSASPSSAPAPAVTPDPSAAPPSDWLQSRAGDVLFWLPPRFVGGELGAQTDATAARVIALGGACVNAGEQFKQLVPFEFAAVDSARCAGGALTNMTINRQEAPDDVSAQAHVAEGVGQLPAGYTVGEWQELTLGGRESGRLLVDGTAVDGSRVGFYAMRDRGTLWSLTFSSGSADFDALLPEFDQIAVLFEAGLPDQ